MNDKMKGLIVGLTIGSLLSGTAAFAAGSQIEVAFRNLKYMFDGVEKAPAEGKGFIYEGSTYVPLRFVSEALGKPVEWDEANETIWVGKNPSHVAATYKGGQVTEGELDKFIAVLAFLQPQGAGDANDRSYREYMVKQLIQLKIWASKASEAEAADAKTEADKQIALWKTKESEQQFVDALTAAKLTEADVSGFLTTHFNAQNAAASSISDAEAKAKFDANLAADKDTYTTASVRHILIATIDTSSPDRKALRTKEEALARAKEVQQKLKNGGDFTALAKEYSDDPGSKNKGGLYENAQVSGWVANFKKAAVELEVGKLSDPVESEFGYHVMKVEARNVKTFDDVKADLRKQLANEKMQQFAQKELPALIEKIDLSQ